MTPFILYPGCDYLYDDSLCEYIEPVVDSHTEQDRLIIRLKADGQYYHVDRISVSPIPLRTDRMDNYIGNLSCKPQKDNLVWESTDSEHPFTIIYNGRNFSYTNPKLKEAGECPIPVFFLSDLQAVRSSFES